MAEAPEILVEHLSYTQLNAWTGCGEAFRLERVVRVPRTPAWRFIGGTAVHEVTENYDLRSLGVDIPAADFGEVFERLTQEAEEESGVDRKDFRASGRASKDWPDKENQDWWLEHGPAMCRRWGSWRRATRWELWVGPNGEFGIELPFNLHLQRSEVVIHGVIDRVFEDPSSNSLVILDLKTGTSLPITPRQLGTYKAGFEQAFPDAGSIRFGTFWDARKGSTGPIHSLDPYVSDRLEYQYGALRFARENGLYLPNPSFCSSCGVRDWCYEVGGPRAHEVPPPWATEEES